MGSVLYAIEVKLVSFQRDWYKFRMFNGTSMLTMKEISKYLKKKNTLRKGEGNQNISLQNK